MTEKKKPETTRGFTIPSAMERVVENMFKNDLKLVKKHIEKPARKAQKEKDEESK